MSDLGAERYYSWKEVRPMVGNIGRNTWDRLINSGRAPAGVRVSPGRVAWPESKIREYQRRLQSDWSSS
jgi:predicted DNA-binding transcriptional regulator AlpA